MTPRRILALDLGGRTFKGVLAERGRDKGFTVCRVKLLELSPNADPTLRQAALKELLAEFQPLRSIRIVGVVDDPFLCLKAVAIPPIPEAERAEAIQWELRPSLSVRPEEAIFDFELRGEINGAGSKKLNFLAASVPASKVWENLSFLGQAGVRPVQLIPKAQAIAAWAHRIRPSSQGPIALLDLGGSSSEFLVVQNGELLFTRKIPVSSSDITRGMTAALMTPQGQVSLTEAAAEALKRSVGIPGAAAAEISAGGISGMQVLALIRGSLERLALELERSLVFYGESTAGTPVTELILLGGGAHLKGLSAWLEARLKISATVPDPFTNILRDPAGQEKAPEEMSLSLVPSLGACLRAGSGINLLPSEMKRALKVQVARAVLIGFGTALLLGALLVRIGVGIHHRNLYYRINALRVEEMALAPQLAQARVALFIQAQQLQQPRWKEMLKELSHRVPSESYLVDLNVSQRQVFLRGRVRHQNRPPEVILSEFMRKLEEGLFTQVRLSSSRRLEESSAETEFEILCFLK